MNRVSEKVVYPELSYKIVGTTFRVFNTLGHGMSEKHYQRAFAKELEQEGIKFKREMSVAISYDNESIGKCFLDFVIEDKIVVELKVRFKLGYVHIKQVMEYLKTTGYKLAILVYFTKEGVKYSRIVNSYIK